MSFSLRTTLLFYFIIQLWSPTGVAQTKASEVSGVYLNKQDFLNDAISYERAQDSQNNFKKDINQTVILIRDGVATHFAFGSIFGYFLLGKKYIAFGTKSNCFSNFGYYRLEDEGHVYIYSKSRSSQEQPLFYYYSLGLCEPIKRLTFGNISKDFSNQKEFIAALRKHRSTARDRLDMKDAANDEKIVNDLLEVIFRKD